MTSLVTLVHNFDSVSLHSLSIIAGIPEEDIEEKLVDLIVSDKLLGFKIEGNFLINHNPPPDRHVIAMELLDKLANN